MASSDFSKLTGLVVGLGSIGERHVRNLQHLGVGELIVCRSRGLPPRGVDPDSFEVVIGLEAALLRRPDFAVICTPTSLHFAQALACIEAGVPTLIEKPATTTREELSRLRAAAMAHGTLWSVAYMMRHHPLLKRAKALIRSGELGALRSFRSHWGEYLPDWHPWEDYRDSYAAKAALGGGALLTLSHDLDLAAWFLGVLDEVAVHRGYDSTLEVDVDVISDVLLRSSTGVMGACHLNLIERVARREYSLLFDAGSVQIDYYGSEMTVKRPAETSTLSLKQFDRNDMFLAQNDDFLQQVLRPGGWEALNELSYAQANAVQHIVDQKGTSRYE